MRQGLNIFQLCGHFHFMDSIYSGQTPEISHFDVHEHRLDAPPVILSVPHAGTGYTADILMRSRLSQRDFRMLEDRCADALIAPLIAAGQGAVVAHAPRALIDLNRDERDIDPRIVRDIPAGQAIIQSAKQRGGLGLFPRTLPHYGELWTKPLGWEAALRCIETVHRPYHAAIGALMDDVRGKHGAALLLDIHSMPPLAAPRFGGAAPDVVIGDRFGASASARLSATAQAVIAGLGLEVALNHPYAGSYLIERHGRPESGHHALQIEVSRALYLDAGFDKVGEGLGRMQAVMSALVAALGEELLPGKWAEAAE
jgi:N-formylglutamate amidohydrolase